MNHNTTIKNETPIIEPKPRAVKIVGWILALGSTGAVITYSFAALLLYFVIVAPEPDTEVLQNRDFFDVLFDVFIAILFLLMDIAIRVLFVLSLISIGLGIVFFIGARYLLKFKRWAKNLLTMTSAFVILAIWTVFIALEFVRLETILICSVITLVFGTLIWFLNRKRYARHFS